MIKIDSYIRKSLKRLEVDTVISYMPDPTVGSLISKSPVFLGIPDIATLDFYDYFKSRGVKVIKWAPYAISTWSVLNKDYIHLIFPSDIPNIPPQANLPAFSLIATNRFRLDGGSSPSMAGSQLFISWESVVKEAPTLLTFRSGFNYQFINPTIEKEVDCTKISLDIFRMNLLNNIMLPRPSAYFKLLLERNVLHYLMPELAANIGCQQDRRYHSDDVFTHLMKTVDSCSDKDPLVRLAALMHDVGKAPTRKETHI